jgi:two-component system cell cycle sensor histidine kinase/response regulator CckA
MSEGSAGGGRGGETVLLVEDEEMLADLLETFLQRAGYTVITARDGEEAVQAYLARRQEIAVVLSDCGLPKGSGETVLKEVLAIDHSAKVILISGAACALCASDLARAGAARFLQKPFSQHDVVEAVRDVIDSPTPAARAGSREGRGGSTRQAAYRPKM